MKIFSKGGILLTEVNEAPYSGTFMGERFVTCTAKSPEQIQFLPDDYIDYRGERFILDYTPTDKKTASPGSTGDAFQYELKFVSIANIELKRCLFRNTFLNNNNLHPSSPIVDVFANAQLLSNMILASLNETYQGENQWNITILKDVDAKQINVRDISCWDAVALFKSELNLNYIIKGRNITVGTVGKLIDHIFKYGKGKGLTEIVRTAQSSDNLVTKLSAFGGNRNLPKDYSTYAEAPTLMLPDYKSTGKDYIISEEGVKLYGEIPKVFRDEEIYPSIYDVTADDLRAAGIQTTATGRIDEIVYVEPIQSANQASFRVWIKDIGFDINNYLTPVTALLSMRDGSLGGYEFEIAKVVKDTSIEGAGYKLTLNRNQDDNFTLPDDKTYIKPGDHFVLLEIYMPEVYVRTAEQRLLNRAKEYLAQNDHVKATYSLNLDRVFMANHPSIGDTIYEGDLIRIVDEDLQLDREIIIQNLAIKNSGPVPEYTITLSDDPVATTLGRVQEDIVDIEQNVISNKVDGIKEARRRAIELQLLRSNIFDPDGEIKDTFLQTMMLQVGANSMNYQMGVTSARPRLVNMSFTNTSITLGTDDVIHFAYGAREEAASTWRIDSPFSASGLDETKTYFVAIKASRDNLNAEWIVDENTYSVESFPGYYIFNFGILNAIDDGTRSFSETRGNIYSYGDELAAGVISSVDNYCWFNLNTGDFQLYNKKTGQGLQFKDGALTLGSFDPVSGKFNATIEGIIDDAKEAGMASGSSAAQNKIDNLQIGGTNYLLRSVQKKGWYFNLFGGGELHYYDDHFEVITSSADAGRNGIYNAWENFFTKDLGGKDIVLGFDAKSDTNGAIAQVYSNKNIDNVEEFRLTTNYKRYFLKIKYFIPASSALIISSTTRNTKYYLKDFKVEEGDKGTDYSLSQQDQEELSAASGSLAAQDKINNLEIGGINLLNNSKNIFLLNSDNSNVITEKGKITVITDGDWNAYVHENNFADEIKNSYGKEFVVSVDIKTNKDAEFYTRGQWSGSHNISNSAFNIKTKANEFKRFSYLVKTPETPFTHFIFILFGKDQNGLIVEYKNYMMEAGNKASATWRSSEMDQEIKRIAQSWTGGGMLYKDPTFKEGNNGITLYNNIHSTHPNVEITRIPRLSDSPFRDPYNIQIKNTGLAAPDLGGFTFITWARANAVFVARFIAKIPSGYIINFNTNPIGDSPERLWATHQAGTGEWQEYIYYLKCGSTGIFSATMYFSLEGPCGTKENPVVWYLAYASVFDMTSGENAQAQLSEWASDNKISPVEKEGLKQQLAAISSEYNEIHERVLRSNLLKNSEWEAYYSAFVAAREAINKYTSSTPETITIGEDFANISAYYPKKQSIETLLNYNENNAKTKVQIDTTGLNEDLFYPVTMEIKTDRRASFKVMASEYESYPNWSTHNAKTFTCECSWEANGSGWGWKKINRYIHSFEYNFANTSPIGSIGQMDRSNFEYICVRGGAKYNFITENVNSIVLHSEAYTINGQTIAPESSVTTPVVDVDEAKRLANETQFLKNAFKSSSVTIGSGIVMSGGVFVESDPGSGIVSAGMAGYIPTGFSNYPMFFAGAKSANEANNAKIAFFKDGSGWLAGKSISWDANGNATFTGLIRSSSSDSRFEINPFDNTLKMINNNIELFRLSFEGSGNSGSINPFMYMRTTDIINGNYFGANFSPNGIRIMQNSPSLNHLILELAHNSFFIRSLPGYRTSSANAKALPIGTVIADTGDMSNGYAVLRIKKE